MIKGFHPLGRAPFYFALIIFYLIFHAHSALSRELYEINRSVRSLGMGNAYSSIVRDADALFYNPAGLGLKSSFYWTIVDPYVGLNGMDALTEIQNFQSSGDFASALSNLSGKKIWSGLGAKSALRLPHFAAAIYNHVDAFLEIESQALPELKVNYINDFGYAVGTGFPVLPFTYMGLSVRSITRRGGRTVFDTATLATLDYETFDAAISHEGRGLAVDAGLLFAISSPLEPALSVVVKNMGGTKFKSSGEDPPSDEEEWIAGASLTTDLGLISISPSLDVKHLEESGVPLIKKSHIGIEFALPLVDLRAGLHQGYWTAGLGIGFGPLQLDLASYGVELGDEALEREDRRYLLQATIEFGFEASQDSSSSKGGDVRARRKRIHLKQRR